MAFGVTGYLTEGFKFRLPPNIAWDSLGAKVNKIGHVCDLKPLDGYAGVISCEFGDKSAQKSLFLYGDSHSVAISDEVHKVSLP